MARMTVEKKGQLTLSFNWIFVLIAGAVILLFFIGIIMKQKTVSENKLNFDIIQIVDSIFVGASVAEKTINTVDISGISDYTLFFECEMDDSSGALIEGSYNDIFAQFGILADEESKFGSSANKEIKAQSLFAPKYIKGSELISWSLPYDLPFKVADMLMVSGDSIQYYILGGAGTSFKEELENATEAMNMEFISSSSEIVGIGSNYHLRIIDLDGVYLYDGAPLPAVLKSAEDSKVSAIGFSSIGNSFDYYEKDGDFFELKNKQGSIPIISLSTQTRDAAKIASFFTGDHESYQCNMIKAFARMEIITEIYEERVEELIGYYNDPSHYDSNCLLLLDHSSSSLDAVGVLSSMKSKLTDCVNVGYEECIGVEEYAFQLYELNQQLDSKSCVTIY